MLRIFAILLCSTFLFSCNGKKIGYLDNAKLFNSFQLKKKLQAELENSISKDKAQLDSMELELKVMSTKLTEKSPEKDKEAFFQKKKIYSIYKERFEEDKDKQVKSMDYQIWNQLNTYVSEYGKENSYDLILASSGEGNVMYVEKDMNITDKVIEFVNKKYKGN